MTRTGIQFIKQFLTGTFSSLYIAVCLFLQDQVAVRKSTQCFEQALKVRPEFASEDLQAKDPPHVNNQISQKFLEPNEVFHFHLPEALSEQLAQFKEDNLNLLLALGNLNALVEEDVSVEHA